MRRTNKKARNSDNNIQFSLHLIMLDNVLLKKKNIPFKLLDMSTSKTPLFYL